MTCCPTCGAALDVGIGLTGRQRDLWHGLARYARENGGKMPSFTDLRTMLGIKSQSSVFRLLTSLEERGYIDRHYGATRGIELRRWPSSPESILSFAAGAAEGEPARTGSKG